MSDRPVAIRAVLAAHGQEHLLTFYDRLPPQQAEALLQQLESIDFDDVGAMIKRLPICHYWV